MTDVGLTSSPGPAVRRYARDRGRTYDEVDLALSNVHRFVRGVRALNRWSEGGAKRAIEYVEGNQWPDNEREARKRTGRPCLTINKLASLVRLVLGYANQNKKQIMYRPGNTFTASADVADVLNKVSQAIDGTPCVRWEFAQGEVFLDGLLTGRGYVDQRIDFDRNMLGEISLTVQDPFLCIPDPEADTYDPSGWGFVSTAQWLSFDEVHKLWGQAALRQSMSTAQYTGPLGAITDYALADRDIVRPHRYFGQYNDEDPQELDYFWDPETPLLLEPGDDVFLYDRSRRLVRAIDTQYKVLERGLQFVDIVTGRTMPINPEVWTKDKINAALAFSEAQGGASGVGQTLFVRESYYDVWYWTVTAGDRVLWHRRSPYSRPTKVPYFAYWRHGKTRGMIEDLLDPQDEINRRRTNFAEIISKIANGGWIYAEDALSIDQEANLRQFGSTPGVHVKHRAGKERPEQIPPGLPPSSQRILEDAAGLDLKEIAGINDAALGQLEHVESGRAIIAKQRSTIVGVEPYMSNFDRTLHLLGEQRLELLQGFYTEERLFRLRGDDGRDEIVTINSRMADGTIVNDITKGTYSATVDSQPLTATFEDAAFESYMDLINAGVPIPPDELLAVAPIPNRQRVIEKVLAAQQAQMAAAAAATPPAPGGGSPLPPGPGPSGGV